ncbi:Signal peptide protein [Planctomycetales bacterium 10988]|nr:Signal peptide protein [Planctomycetales bacterium 10988]
MSNTMSMWLSCCAALACLGGTLTVSAADPGKKLPVVFEDDFEQGAAHWTPTDSKVWEVTKLEDGNHVYNLKERRGSYKPPQRSPYTIALRENVIVGEFVLDVKVKSTIEDYGHRDLCLFFGYQDPSHFYYVHFGKEMDDHANQIFIVNDAPRTKISTKTTEGTPWTDEWHHLRVVRRTNNGVIRVYFDDMKKPAMVAKDKTFTWGKIGVGSFDDIGYFDDLVLRGVQVDQPSQ